jgi:multiple sugar transport system substrate-binding protein
MPDVKTGQREGTFRIAMRRFDPFAESIPKQWTDFVDTTRCPLRLEWEMLDLNPLVDSLFTRGGLKDGTWDVAFIITDRLAEAVAGGSLRDLTPFMRDQPIPDYPEGWSPALTGMQQFGDVIYGLPYHDGPECFIYRTDLFADPKEQAAFAARFGYPLAVPRTWEQFEDVARFFTRPHEGLYGTVFAAYPDAHNTVYDFCLQLWSRGGELAHADGTVTLATPEAVAALDFYRRMVNDRGLTPPGLQAVDSIKSGELFASGAVAMMVNWFGFAAACEQPGCPVKGKTGVATLPTADGRAPVSLVVYYLLTVASGSPHPDVGYAFLRHCATPAMDKITTLAGGIGCRLSTWSDPEVNAANPLYAELPGLYAGTRTLPRSRDLPAFVLLIDDLVQEAIRTDEPSEAILRRAQEKAAGLRLT